MHTHLHAHTHARRHTHMHARTHKHTHMHAHTHTHKHTHTHTHTGTRTHERTLLLKLFFLLPGGSEIEMNTVVCSFHSVPLLSEVIWTAAALLLSIAVSCAMASGCRRDILAGLGAYTSLCLFLCVPHNYLLALTLFCQDLYTCFMGSLCPLLSSPTPPSLNLPPSWFQWPRPPTVAQKMFSVCYTWIKGA